MCKIKTGSWKSNMDVFVNFTTNSKAPSTKYLSELQNKQMYPLVCYFISFSAKGINGLKRGKIEAEVRHAVPKGLK